MKKPDYREDLRLDAPTPSGEERRVPRPARYASWMQRVAAHDEKQDHDDRDDAHHG